jgi:hypothetical protein
MANHSTDALPGHTITLPTYVNTNTLIPKVDTSTLQESQEVRESSEADILLGLLSVKYMNLEDLLTKCSRKKDPANNEIRDALKKVTDFLRKKMSK